MAAPAVIAAVATAATPIDIAMVRWILARFTMPACTYRLHDQAGDDLGLLEHPAPNVDPGDVIVLADGGKLS